MTLDGTCRVGVFSQPMKATVAARRGDGYAGKFNDGANGKGLDVTSGSVNGNKGGFRPQSQTAQRRNAGTRFRSGIR